MVYHGQRGQHDREGSGGLMMAPVSAAHNGDFFHWPNVFPVPSQQSALPHPASQRPTTSTASGAPRSSEGGLKPAKSLIRDTSFPSLASTKCVDSADVHMAGPSTAQRPHRTAQSGTKSSRRHKRINHSSSFFVSPSSSSSRFSLGSDETPEFYDVARLPPTEIHGHPSFIPTDAAKVPDAAKSKQKAGRIRRKSSSSKESDRAEVEEALQSLSIRGNAIGIPTFAGPPPADLHRKKQPPRTHPVADYTQLTINGHAARYQPNEAEPWSALLQQTQSEMNRQSETPRVAHWQRPTSKRKSRSISSSKTAANADATPTASTLLLTDSGRRVLREQSCPPSPRYSKRRSIGDAIWAGTIPGFTEESWQSSDGLQGHGEMCIYPDEEEFEELETPEVEEAPLVLRPSPQNLHRPVAGSAESSFNLTGSVPDGLQASLEGLHITVPSTQEEKMDECLPWSPNAMNRLKVVKSKTTLVDDQTRLPHYAQLPEVSRPIIPSLAKKTVVPPTIAHRTPSIGGESEPPKVEASARTWAQVAKKPQSHTKSEHFTTATGPPADEKQDTIPRSDTDVTPSGEEAEWVEIRRTKGRVKLPTHYPSFQTSQ